MMLRILTLAGGLSGAAGLSQFPEFSQQYAQRLGGAVDALEQVVADFDASAAAEGLSRDAALKQMVGSAFVERRRADMQRTITRYDVLQGQAIAFEKAGPFMRAYHTPGMDREIVRATWTAFQPAVPLTFAGGVFAAFGFVLGGAFMGGVMGAVRAVSRRALTRRPRLDPS